MAGEGSGLECLKSLLKEADGAVLFVLDEPARTVEQASKLLGVSAAEIVKTIVVRGSLGDYAVVLRGDCKLSLEKLAKALGEASLRLAKASEVKELTGFEAGGVPPVCLGPRVKVVVDERVSSMAFAVGGGGHERFLVKLPARLIFETSARAVKADVAEC